MSFLKRSLDITETEPERVEQSINADFCLTNMCSTNVKEAHARCPEDLLPRPL